MTPKIDVGTKVRTVALFVALINQILAVFGLSPIPFEEEAVTMAVSSILLGALALLTWWKDNDLSKHARRFKKPEKKK